MRKRLPALFLAVGMTAAPMFAKQVNRKSDNSQAPQIEDNKQDRDANTVKRQKLLEAEKERIKETEQEIAQALVSPKTNLTEAKMNSLNKGLSIKVVVKDQMPINGIDISDQFRIIHKSESS